MRANQNTLDLRTLYQRRFPQVIQQRKIAVWSVLCRQWFARYVPADSRVLEVAAGFCEFINNIHAAEHVAVDVNPDVRHYAAPHVKVYEIAVERMDDEEPAWVIASSNACFRLEPDPRRAAIHSAPNAKPRPVW